MIQSVRDAVYGIDSRALRERVLPHTEAEWDAWHAMARRHFVDSIIALNPPSELPSRLSETMREDARRLALRNLAAVAECHDVLRALADDGVDALLYKGPVTATDAFGALHARRFVDADILVSPADYAAARTRLTRLGYKSLHRLGIRQERAYVAAYRQMPFARDDTITIEVHTGLMPAYLPMSPYDPGFFERARTVSLGGRTARTLSVEDHFLLLCMHGTKEAWPHIRSVADVAGMLHRQDVAMDVVRKHARRAHTRLALDLALHLAGWLHDPQMPPSSPAEHRVRRRLSGNGRPSSADEAHVVAPALDRRADQLRFAWHHLTGHTIADWERWPLGDHLLTGARVMRPLRLLWKYLRGETRAG